MLSVVIYTLGLNSRVDTLDFNGMRAFTARPRRTVTRPIPADICSPPDHFAGLTHPDLELSPVFMYNVKKAKDEQLVESALDPV